MFIVVHLFDIVKLFSEQKPVTDGYTALQGLRVIWKLYDAEKNNIVADLRGLGLNQR